MVRNLTRRKVLASSGLALSVAVAGCAASDDDDEDNGDEDSDESDNEDNGDENGDNGGDNGDDSEDGGDTDDDAEGDGATFEVRVVYDGEWQGAVGEEGSTSSVSGEGEETLEIEGEPSVISANAQKQDDSDDELVIQILENGDVVEEESTTAEFGMAQVTYSAF